jgi:glutamate synthase domain-containing protein 2
MDGCKGQCESWLSTFRGREVLYAGPFGEMTTGAEKNYPIDYSHINIQGYAVGAKGLPAGSAVNSDTAIFSDVNTETEYGWDRKVRMRLPIFTGALGSTEIARVNWEHMAIGAAISGITCVCGENVCGVDPGLILDSNGKVQRSPEMDRRISIWKKFAEGYGEMLVQLNVEDTRIGTAEYVASRHNLETIELKWGQGAKSIGGEVKVSSLERAIELKKRGYLVLPDPTLPVNEHAFKSGGLKEFERHSRLGFITREEFFKRTDGLRDIGFKRITVKTGAYSAVELAMAIRYCSEAKIDLLTIDGAPGGTGMSPWPMMNEWGIPTFYLQALMYEFCTKLAAKGMRVPSIAMAGGFSDEPNAFKALAMGSPFVKAICMGRGLLIPAMVGKHIGQWVKDGDLPKTVSRYGNTLEEIFISYEELKQRFGTRFNEIPTGAIGVYTYTQKFRTGLQQLMAGSRNFSVPSISRRDVMALTEEAAKVSGIPYVMDALHDEALSILLD